MAQQMISWGRREADGRLAARAINEASAVVRLDLETRHRGARFRPCVDAAGTWR